MHHKLLRAVLTQNELSIEINGVTLVIKRMTVIFPENEAKFELFITTKNKI